jgi:retinal rod rhodopsin-sensitive cGMP 3',5'-cyclic phosphodiesterase subunit delta
VSREIIFNASVEIHRLRLEQQILLHDVTIEEYKFDFGYVIAGSTNTWEQIIVSDQGSMLDAVNLSGNLIIVNSFFDGDVVVARCNVRIFYI